MTSHKNLGIITQNAVDGDHGWRIFKPLSWTHAQIRRWKFGPFARFCFFKKNNGSLKKILRSFSFLRSLFSGITCSSFLFGFADQISWAAAARFGAGSARFSLLISFAPDSKLETAEKRYKLIAFFSASESRSKTLKKSVSTSASCALSREHQSALMPDQLRLFFTTLSSSDFSSQNTTTKFDNL